MAASAVAPLLLLAFVLGCVVWVYSDAKAQERLGAPVVFSTGFITLETPGAWALGCLIVFIAVLPLYLTARRQGR